MAIQIWKEPLLHDYIMHNPLYATTGCVPSDLEAYYPDGRDEVTLSPASWLAKLSEKDDSWNHAIVVNGKEPFYPEKYCGFWYYDYQKREWYQDEVWVILNPETHHLVMEQRYHDRVVSSTKDLAWLEMISTTKSYNRKYFIESSDHSLTPTTKEDFYRIAGVAN